MNLTKKNKILLILIVFIFLIFVVVKLIIDNNKTLIGHELIDEYESIYKKYDVNEYTVINISDEQLANIYLNNFKYYLVNDIDYAYGLLDNDYKKIKFGTIENFTDYVKKIEYNNFSIKEYSVDSNKEFIEVILLNDEKIIFKINGVLDYKVYLDDNTVKIY